MPLEISNEEIKETYHVQKLIFLILNNIIIPLEMYFCGFLNDSKHNYQYSFYTAAPQR